MLRSPYMKQYVFFVQMQSHVLAALFFECYVRHFGSLHPAFEMSCDTEYLFKRLLIFFGNVIFVVLYFVQIFWRFSSKHSEKYWTTSPKKTQTFQNDVEYVPEMTFFSSAQLCSACCFGCNSKSCFENFFRSLYLKHVVFFVQMQSHVLAALNFEGYLWYFRSLHLAFEMSWDI